MTKSSSAVILADGGIDLPEGFAERYGIRTLPLMLFFGTEALRSGVDITTAEFYQRLPRDPHHPTTSQPSVGDYVEFYREAAKAGLPILSFHLSSALSGSLASAKAAKDLLPELDIRLVDTGTLSGAMGLQVLVAAEMARRGEPIEAILAEVKRIHEKTDTFYTIDTLEYLRKGGRIGRVAGFVGTLLGIRPIITVDKKTGTYVGAGKGRSFKMAANSIVDQIVDDIGEGGEISCMVIHGECEAEALRMVENLRNRLTVRWLKVIRINPSLGVHVGPTAVGIAFYRGLLPIGEATLAMEGASD